MATRDRIAQAAFELFTKKGYAATMIAEIETAAGLAPRTGGFYLHCPSKEALAVAIGGASVIESIVCITWVCP